MRWMLVLNPQARQSEATPPLTTLSGIVTTRPWPIRQTHWHQPYDIRHPAQQRTDCRQEGFSSGLTSWYGDTLRITLVRVLSSGLTSWYGDTLRITLVRVLSSGLTSWYGGTLRITLVRVLSSGLTSWYGDTLRFTLVRVLSSGLTSWYGDTLRITLVRVLSSGLTSWYGDTLRITLVRVHTPKMRSFDIPFVVGVGNCWINSRVVVDLKHHVTWRQCPVALPKGRPSPLTYLSWSLAADSSCSMAPWHATVKQLACESS